jgi:sugar lactone lactonase YvrE
MEYRRLRRLLGRIFLALAALVAAGLLFVKLRYGGGAPYPDVNTPPLVAPSDVRTLIELEMPPGNVTSSRDGRIFFNTHPFTQSHRFTDAFLFEIVDGMKRPYPDAAAQADARFVFGMTVDGQGRLWLISPAELERDRTRIQAYDLGSNRRVIDHELPPGVGRFAQDLRVSKDGRTLFLADTGALRFTRAAILVVDVESWAAREVLANDPSTQPQDWVMRSRTPQGPHRIGFGLITFQVGVDGIALSQDGAWLYYGTMTHDTLHRIRTEHLMDPRLSPGELASRVERVGRKPMSDGIEVAEDGGVLLTDVENGSVVRIDPSGRLTTLVRDARIVWSDGINITAGGDVLLTDSSISSYTDQLMRPPKLAVLEAGRPYRIYRFHLPGGGHPAP